MEKNRFLERQPNSDTREEFLIVIDYLQNEAFDEEHASTQTDIIEYARQKYNKEIRRDRIGQILIHLEQLSNNPSFQLPFKLKTLKLNKIQKYYIPQRIFSDEEIVRIIAALEKDSNLSPSLTKLLCEKVLDITASNNKHKELMLKSQKRITGAKKINQKILDISEAFLKAVDSHDRIIFHLKDHKEAEFSSSILTLNIGERLENEKNYGFAYCVITPDNEPMPVVYIDEYKIAFVTKFSNLVIDEVHEIWQEIDETYFCIKGKYKAINEWLNDHFKGKDGYLYNYKLMYHIYSDKAFIEYQNKFKEYWKEEFKFQLEEKIISHTEEDKNGNKIKKTYVSKYAIFEIEANRTAFYHWYEKLGHFDDTIILEPAYLNDLFLDTKIRKYTERLNRFGDEYYYRVEKEMKNNFKKMLAKNREDFSYKRDNEKK